MAVCYCRLCRTLYPTDRELVRCDDCGRDLTYRRDGSAEELRAQGFRSATHYAAAWDAPKRSPLSPPVTPPPRQTPPAQPRPSAPPPPRQTPPAPPRPSAPPPPRQTPSSGREAPQAPSEPRFQGRTADTPTAPPEPPRRRSFRRAAPAERRRIAAIVGVIAGGIVILCLLDALLRNLGAILEALGPVVVLILAGVAGWLYIRYRWFRRRRR